MITKCQYPNCNHQAHFLMGWTNENGKLHWGLVCATHDKMLGRANLCKYMPLSEAILFERYLRETVNLESYLDFPEWLAQQHPRVVPTIIKPTTPAGDQLVTLLTLSPRAHNALRRYGITTIKELLNLSDHELSKIRMIGTTCIHEIHEQLKELGHERKTNDNKTNPSSEQTH